MKPAEVAALTRCVSAAPAVFAREYWGIQPLYSTATATASTSTTTPATASDPARPTGFADLFSPAAADELLTERALRTPFIRMAKAGSVLEQASYTAPGGFGAQVADQVDSAMVLREFADGATIVLQGLHRTWPPLRTFTRRLVAELGHPAQVNAYITPASSRGFDPHYDVHDVFVLQVSGEKRWRVHAPVLEHPRADEPWTGRRAAVEERAREQPVIDVVMRPGDALYLPSGWLHSAVACEGTSIHLTIGVAALTGADVVRELVAEVSKSKDLRAPLPIDTPGALEDAVQHITTSFIQTLGNTTSTKRTTEAIKRSLQRLVRPEPVAPLATVETATNLAPKTQVRLRDGLPAQVSLDPSGVRLAAGGQALRLPAACEPAVRALASGERHWAGSLPGLDEADSLVVTRRLLRCGLLVAEPRD